MSLLARRRALMAASGNGVDVLYGSVTVGSNHNIVIPVPSDYSFVCWIDSDKPNASNNYLAEFGQFLSLTYGGGRKWRIKGDSSGGNGWRITRTDTNVSFVADNANTEGFAPEGSVYKYFAWR